MKHINQVEKSEFAEIFAEGDKFKNIWPRGGKIPIFQYLEQFLLSTAML